MDYLRTTLGIAALVVLVSGCGTGDSVDPVNVDDTAGTSGSGDTADIANPGAAAQGSDVQADGPGSASPSQSRGLPATASPLPALGLVGMISLAAAAAVRQLRRRH